ncbi:MAG: AmmeMemoRadiSam system radical SAM enzyme [Candidatus Omnitrophica bacterium]|nr:AmmeMemoRadiSam system radical SAM enzyme [Candidatus Omnitrophota bacterium]
MNRREFLKRTCMLAAGIGFSPLILDIFFKRLYSSSLVPFRKEGKYYKNIDEETVQCELCPRKCTLTSGQRSFCRAREPKDGKLYSLVYGLPCAVHIDPIEKKPLFHFIPGSKIFSIATAGCNFRCKYCQNWSISQFPPEDTDNENLLPEDVVKTTIKMNCPSIAYTYTEPAIFYEYMLDVAKLARAKGIKNMYHSNGSLNPEPAEELAQYLDGANIDLKAFNQDFYSEVCAGFLDTVLNTLKILKRKGVWVEITNLVVPSLNDNLNQIRDMCIWIKQNLGKETPLHFSRFWPQYKLTSLPPTPVSTLESAREIAQEVGLNFVYIGNVPGHKAENTYCPECQKVVIRRTGYSILENYIEEGRCRFCKYPFPGVWS